MAAAVCGVNTSSQRRKRPAAYLLPALPPPSLRRKESLATFAFPSEPPTSESRPFSCYDCYIPCSESCRFPATPDDYTYPPPPTEVLLTFGAVMSQEHPDVVPLLPPKDPSSPKPTLVLDLDETLVHCATEGLEGADFSFRVTLGDVTYDVYAKKRPHCDAFLRWAASAFEVIVFTASHQAYADVVLDVLDPTRTLIAHRLYRESCVLSKGTFVKHLGVLGRDLATTLIVDNTPQAFATHPDNGVPILSWVGCGNDAEFPRLVPFLAAAAIAADVRDVVRSRFGLAAVAADVFQLVCGGAGGTAGTPQTGSEGETSLSGSDATLGVSVGTVGDGQEEGDGEPEGGMGPEGDGGMGKDSDAPAAARDGGRY